MEYRIGSPNDFLHEEECTRQEDKDEGCPGNGLYKGLVRANQGRMEVGASAGDGQGSKSSSRLDRNAVDALSACRKLKGYNCDVYFQVKADRTF